MNKEDSSFFHTSSIKKESPKKDQEEVEKNGDDQEQLEGGELQSEEVGVLQDQQAIAMTERGLIYNDRATGNILTELQLENESDSQQRFTQMAKDGL